jgi:nucleotide-binding universal stress UspA family protein
MKRILVATDFSSRSDMAVQRAAHLAAQFAATLHIVHVVDTDLPPRLVEAERATAAGLLDEFATALRAEHRLECVVSVATANEAFVGVLQTARDDDADLIVVGAHRRRILLDIFVGTTAERIIRNSSIPVLMVNAKPRDAYRRMLIAVDLSETSSEVLLAAQRLQWLGAAHHAAVYAFDMPAASLLTVLGGIETEEMANYMTQERRQAEGELRTALTQLKLRDLEGIAVPLHGDASVAIRNCATRESADVIVVATHGRGGVAKALLGSVAQDLLRTADQDVLVVPKKAAV